MSSPSPALRGLDVSSWQEAVNWGAVAGSGCAFAIAKASERTTYVDPRFAENWIGMRTAGLVRGAYHFARPSLNSPISEAAHFLMVLADAGGVAPGDLVALDLEDPNVAAGTDLLPWALAWLQAVEAVVGVAPLLYSNTGYLQNHGCVRREGQPDITRFPLWLAAWQQSPPLPPGGWPQLAVWQYTDAAVVPGVVAPCDGDASANVELLRILGVPAAADAEAAERAALDRLWHVASLLDGISGHDLADQVRSDTVLLKEALGLNG